MEEKILNNKKNGMFVLLLTILLYIAAIVLLIYSSFKFGEESAIFIICVIYISIGWFPVMGLKILKPQEALVLTLFGNYYGTIKGEGFYFVNPFCGSINPAAKTKLNQSGDVENEDKGMTLAQFTGSTQLKTIDNKISLKIMTLSNNRQKVNDCLIDRYY